MLTNLMSRARSKASERSGLMTPLSTAERAGLTAQSSKLMLGSYKYIAGSTAMLVLLLWPFDSFVFDYSPQITAALTNVRATILSVCLIYLVIIPQTGLMERYPFTMWCLATSITCGGLGWAISPMGYDNGPTTYYLFFLPGLSIVFLVPMFQRILVNVLISVSVFGGFYLRTPSNWSHPYASPSFALLLMVSALSIVAGQVLYALTVSNLRQSRVLTEQKQQMRDLNDSLEARVEQQTRELRALTQRVQTIQEEERLWLAREIHDELGQGLTAISFASRYTRSRFERDPTTVGVGLDEIDHLIKRSQMTLRRIMKHLRPAILEQLGLTEAVRWLVTNTAESKGLTCDMALSTQPPTFDATLGSVIFRATQEAIHNTLRHANASKLWIRLEYDHGFVCCVIEDDGVGLNPPSTSTNSGVGMIGIRERLNGVGGHARWSESEHGGVRLELTAPLEEAQRSNDLVEGLL